jgi:HSP20 family protein
MLTLWNQFDDLFADELFKARRPAARTFMPAVDIEETKDGYVLTADIPGMKPEEVEVTIEDGVLAVRGERKLEAREEHDGYKRLERTFGEFRRSFVLPKGVNPDAIEASVEHGQLVVRVPKPTTVLPRKVEVKTLPKV